MLQWQKKQPRKLDKELMPKGLRLMEKVRKESVPRHHENSVKTGLHLEEKLPKKNRAEESQEQRENRQNYGTTSESKRFLLNIRKCNSCFEMTSFGAQIENQDQYTGTQRI